VLQSIVENLTLQKSAYAHILELSKREQTALVASDAQLVNDLVKQVWIELSETSRLEDKRMDLVKRYCSGRGEAYSEQTLSSLISCVDAEAALKLETLKTELHSILKQQSIVNQLNKELLELHFQYISFVIDTVSQQSQPTSFYGSAGEERVDSMATLGLLDSQI
jgi:flagellar biosynthesis/type III secretory pathway chaperone